MKFSGFVLGLRFSLAKASRMTEQEAFSVLFSRIPAKLVGGMKLYRMTDEANTYLPEPSVLLVFTNATLSAAQALYRQIASDTVLMSCLSIYEPFIQTNRSERCTDVVFVGSVGENGVVEGGDAAFGPMRFTGSCTQAKKPIRLLVAAADGCVREISGRIGEADDTILTRPFPISGSILNDAVALASGRYGFTKSGILYGALPERTAVVACAALTDEAVSRAVEELYAYGYRSVFLDGVADTAAPVSRDGMRFIRNRCELIPFERAVRGIDAAVIDRAITESPICARLIAVLNEKGIPFVTADGSADGGCADAVADSILKPLRKLCGRNGLERRRAHHNANG